METPDWRTAWRLHQTGAPASNVCEAWRAVDRKEVWTSRASAVDGEPFTHGAEDEPHTHGR